MITKKIHEKIQLYVGRLKVHADRIWYPPLIAALAALDNLIVVIPTDGILISSSMLTPKRWPLLAFAISFGSTVGALLLAGLVEFHGLPWILEIYPGVDQTWTWSVTNEFFDRYGLLLVFVVAATPLMQQPAVILASLAGTPLFELGVVVFVGRFLKYLLMAYAGARAPQLLSRMWGIRDELQDAGVKVP